MIQAGIGGSFDTGQELGATVIVGDEIIADLGVEENNLFNDLFDMGFVLPDAVPYTGKRLVNPGIPELKKLGFPVVSGATVNEITTNPNRVAQIREKYNPGIESMEGAAFHYVCLQQNIPFIQLRAASNYVGERDKSKWKLNNAVRNLNESLIKIIQQIA
jgi:futalosine hydrolase